jgi:hypothetical protein
MSGSAGTASELPREPLEPVAEPDAARQPEAPAELRLAELHLAELRLVELLLKDSQDL